MIPITVDVHVILNVFIFVFTFTFDEMIVMRIRVNGMVNLILIY